MKKLKKILKIPMTSFMSLLHFEIEMRKQDLKISK